MVTVSGSGLSLWALSRSAPVTDTMKAPGTNNTLTHAQHSGARGRSARGHHPGATHHSPTGNGAPVHMA